MNFILFCTFTVTIYFTYTEAISIKWNTNINSFEKVKGDEPSFLLGVDPFAFHATQFRFNGPILRLQTNMSNGLITGASNFLVDEYEFSKQELSLSIQMNFPRLTLETDFYEMKGAVLELVPISGKGKLYAEIDNLRINTKIYVKQSSNGKSVLIDKFVNSSYSIETVLSRTQFDNIFDDILNKMVEEMLASYLTRFNKYIVVTYKDDIVSTANSVLEQYETWEIFNSLF